MSMDYRRTLLKFVSFSLLCCMCAVNSFEFNFRLCVQLERFWECSNKWGWSSFCSFHYCFPFSLCFVLSPILWFVGLIFMVCLCSLRASFTSFRKLLYYLLPSLVALPRLSLHKFLYLPSVLQYVVCHSVSIISFFIVHYPHVGATFVPLSSSFFAGSFFCIFHSFSFFFLDFGPQLLAFSHTQAFHSRVSIFTTIMGWSWCVFNAPGTFPLSQYWSLSFTPNPIYSPPPVLQVLYCGTIIVQPCFVAHLWIFWVAGL